MALNHQAITNLPVDPTEQQDDSRKKLVLLGNKCEKRLPEVCAARQIGSPSCLSSFNLPGISTSFMEATHRGADEESYDGRFPRLK